MGTVCLSHVQACAWGLFCLRDTFNPIAFYKNQIYEDIKKQKHIYKALAAQGDTFLGRFIYNVEINQYSQVWISESLIECVDADTADICVLPNLGQCWRGQHIYTHITRIFIPTPLWHQIFTASPSKLYNTQMDGRGLPKEFPPILPPFHRLPESS